MIILINSDYEKILPLLQSVRISLCLTDPPYGITNNKWDTRPVDFISELLKSKIQVENIVSCADIKYASFLINQHSKLFSHDLIWQKTIGSGQLNINKQPLRLHEIVLVFKLLKSTTYNRLKSKGDPYKIKRNIKTADNYNEQKEHICENKGERDVKSILKIANPRNKGGHPTQKPVELFQQLSEMYSNKNDILLDTFAGSGTILDVKERIIIAIEKETKYYELARSSRAHRVTEEKRATRVPRQPVFSRSPQR